jgi:PPOX class probable F420-dependent enzyme
MTRTASLATLLAVLAAPTAAVGQNPPVAPARASVIEAARDLMRHAGLAGFITIDEDGRPQARVVDAFPPEADMTVWIGTNPRTRKIAQVRRDPRVVLLYTDPAGTGYVTIVGTAVVVNDPAEKAKRWKENWTPYYSDKNRGDDYVLIRVTPQRLEIVSYAHGLLNDPETWLPVTLEFP